MKQKSNIILYYWISLIWSIVLGMLQYFLRSSLKSEWINLEMIAGYISFGIWIAYLMWWPLSSSFKKKKLAIFVAMIAILWLSVFYIVWILPFVIFVILTSIIWFCFGMWAVIKHIIISFEISNSNIRETVLNGILASFTLLWILFWSYMGIKLFDILGQNWYLIIIWLLAISIVMTLFLDYDALFRRKNFYESFKIFTKKTKNILVKYYWLLFPIWILWSMSIWFVQKIFYLWIDLFAISEESAILLYWYGALWAIIWFFLSATFYKKKNIFMFSATILSAWVLFFFLELVNLFSTYIVLQIWAIFLWILFGIMINILEWRYFWYVGKDHDKEYWSAIYGITLNIVNFMIMILSSFLLKNFGIKSTFIFFSIIMISTLFIYKNFDRKISRLEENETNK